MQTLDVAYELKKQQHLVGLIHEVDCLPSYFITGGLVFAPLSWRLLEMGTFDGGEGGLLKGGGDDKGAGVEGGGDDLPGPLVCRLSWPLLEVGLKCYRML